MNITRVHEIVYCGYIVDPAIGESCRNHPTHAVVGLIGSSRVPRRYLRCDRHLGETVDRLGAGIYPHAFGHVEPATPAELEDSFRDVLS